MFMHMGSDKNSTVADILLVLRGILIILTPGVMFLLCDAERRTVPRSAGTKNLLFFGWTPRAETGAV